MRASTARLQVRRRPALRRPQEGPAVAGPQVGSMFAVFFTATPVRDYATALSSDAKAVRANSSAPARRRGLLPQALRDGLPEHRARGLRAIDRACQIMTDAIRRL